MADSMAMDAEMGKNLILGSIFSDGDKLQHLIGAVGHAGPQGPQVLAQMLFQDFQHVKEAIIKNQLPLDPRVWSAQGGVIDQVVKETSQIVASKLGPDYTGPKFMVSTKGFLMKALHDDETSRGGPGSKHLQPDEAEQGPPQGPGPDGPPAPPQGLVAPPDDGSGQPPMPMPGPDEGAM